MKQKEVSVYDSLVRDNVDYLFRFAFFRIGDRQEVEDIVQNAFLRLMEKGVDAIAAENVRMYLFRTVYNLCVDYQRHKPSVEPIDNQAFRVIDECEDDEMLYSEYDRITAIMKSLPEREAEVIRMRAVDGLHFVEISRILNTPVSTIKSRYKSGMEKLRNNF